MHHRFPVDPDSIFDFDHPNLAKSDTPPAPSVPLPCCPQAAASAPNDKYAAMLRSDYCGRDSELSLAFCYLYQSIRFGCCSKELCGCLYDMAMRRIKAAKLLGDLICSLGSDPKYFCGHSGNAPAGSWWNASPTVLKYPQHLGDAIQSAIKRERFLLEEYKNLLSYIDDDGICAVLKTLKAEKEQDIETLQLHYSRFCS